MYCSVADDASAALDAVRPMVATSLVTSRPVLGELGIEMPAAFASLMEERGWRASREAGAGAADAVPDEVARRFALAGSPADCGETLGQLLAAFPQISQVAIVPFPVPGERVMDVVHRFRTEVAPLAAREDAVSTA